MAHRIGSVDSMENDHERDSEPPLHTGDSNPNPDNHRKTSLEDHDHDQDQDQDQDHEQDHGDGHAFLIAPYGLNNHSLHMDDGDNPATVHTLHDSNTESTSGMPPSGTNATATATATTTGGGGTLKSSNNKNEKEWMQILSKNFERCHKEGNLEHTMFNSKMVRMEQMHLWHQVLSRSGNSYANIKEIKIRWCALQSVGIKLLMDGLFQCAIHQNLEVLDLMGNEIGVSGTLAICQILLSPAIDLNKYNFTAAIQDPQTSDLTFDFYTPYHQQNEQRTSLHTLILSCNLTSDAGCVFLGKALSINNKLMHLDLENCEIYDRGVKYIRRGLERNKTILSFNLSANRFGDDGAKELSAILARSRSLESLDISRNRLGPEGTTEIARGLLVNMTLKKLRMNINRSGVKGARVLAKVLLKNNALEELELSYNEIFNEGVQFLSQGLQNNYGLKCLVLWYNGLDDKSAQYFADAMKERALKQGHFKEQMLEAIYFVLRVKYYDNEKTAQNIAEHILAFTPRYMEFALDISHNRRIGRAGINALLDVGERNDSIFIKGFKEFLAMDRKQRNEIALENTSLY